MKKLAYDEIEDLVYAYQDNCQKSITTLVAHYEGYFTKFLEVLKLSHKVDGKMQYSKFDIYSSIQRRFVAAFFRNRTDRNMVKQYRKSIAVRIKLYKTLGHIRHIFSTYEADDLLQIMRIIFIEMAGDHKGTKFYNYVSTTFPKKLLNYLLYYRARFEEELFEEDKVWEYEYIAWDSYEFETHPIKHKIQAHNHTLYPANWINGDCEEPFDHLTPFEREILKLYYEEKTFFPQDYQERSVYNDRRLQLKMSDVDIARNRGCSRKTVNEKRNQIVQNVRETALEKRLIRE